MFIDWGTRGLQYKNIFAPHVLSNLYLNFTVTESFYFGITQPNTDVTANIPG
jgi:hypothetical protein